MAQGHRIDANFTEEIVGLALESFLANLSFPRHQFSIEPFSRSKERWLGADARLLGRMRTFRPFYMQFKRPAAYPDYSKSNIITQRDKMGLTTKPRALYFELRRKQKKHREFQHNALYRLRQRLLKRGLGDAAYVCPLFLDRSTYRFSLHLSGIRRWAPFWHRDPWENDLVILHNGQHRIRFDRIPILAEHVSIPPHATVTSAAHRYSFNENGRELCFHSPEALPEGSMDLAKFLEGVLAGFLDGGAKLSPRESDELLYDLIRDVDGDGDTLASILDLGAGDPVGRWFDWGDHLHREYAIDQYALVRWEDDTDLFN